MNRTHFEHAFFALLMQSVFGAFGFWWTGAALGIGFFLGREHAQREYHIGDPSKLSPLNGFDFWRWPLDSQLDLAFPIVATVGVALLATNV